MQTEYSCLEDIFAFCLFLLFKTWKQGSEQHLLLPLKTNPDNYHSSDCGSIAQMLYGFAQGAITGWTSRTYELCGFGDNRVVYGILWWGTCWNTRVITTRYSVPKEYVLCVFLAQSQTQWVGDSTVVPKTVCNAH